MTWRQYAGNFDNPINPEYEQEARLVDQSRAGSERAFSALLARYQQPVFRLIFYLVGEEEEARDLTRIAIKNALLHMPSVPAGYSIRPWLLRVAVLVALDAVRERSETPQQLLASLQLPAPPAPPRIVDADPAESDTMELGVTRLESLAQRPETAIADAWDDLPVDVERELIRRLLSGLPEGDAELLALGVVGQVPTRDLAALAGTSQRSIRRRVARALILFQSRYYSVRQDALPPASDEKTLPPSDAATTPLELARRSFNEASERVMRTLQGARMGVGPTEAQERLETLRATEVPVADVVNSPPPATPHRSVPLTRDTEDVVIDAEPTMPLPLGQGGPPQEAHFADWTDPVPSMEVPDLATAKTPIVPATDEESASLSRAAHGPPPPSIIPMPPASGAYQPPAEAAMTMPSPLPTENVTTPASPNLAAVTEPLPIVAAEAQTAVRSAPESPPAAAEVTADVAEAPTSADIAIPAANAEAQTAIRTAPSAQEPTVPRRLPRFGPAPENVIVGTPPEIDPFPASEAAEAEAAAPPDAVPSAEVTEVDAVEVSAPDAPQAAAETATPTEGSSEVIEISDATTIATAAALTTPEDAPTDGGADDADDVTPTLAASPLDAPDEAATASAAAEEVTALVADAATVPDDAAAEFAPPADADDVPAVAPSVAQVDETGDTRDESEDMLAVAPAAATEDAVALPEEHATVPEATTSEVETSDTAASKDAMTAADAPSDAVPATDAPPAMMAAEAASTDFSPVTSDGDDAPIEAEAAPETTTDAPTALALEEAEMHASVAEADQEHPAASPKESAFSVSASAPATDETEDVGAAPPAPEAEDDGADAGEANVSASAPEVPAEADVAETPTEDHAAMETSATGDHEAEEADVAAAPTGEHDAPDTETVPDAEGDSIPAPAVSAIERPGAEGVPPRTGTLNSTVVLPPLDRAQYVSRHRPAWLDAADLGGLVGRALGAEGVSDEPPTTSAEPSVPSLGAITISAPSSMPTQVGDIAAAPAEPTVDLADLGDLATPTPPDGSQSGETPRPPRAPTRPLPKLDRDIIDPPRER